MDVIANEVNKRLEFADCFFLLFGAAAADGMSYDDVCAAIQEKFEINLKRQWGKPDANGVVKHIKAEAYAKFKVIPDSETTNKMLFMCPGCNELHAIDATWSFNGDLNKPTIRPSVLVRGWLNKSIPSGTCHSFITDGNIEFLHDCSHNLRGKTVELPVFT